MINPILNNPGYMRLYNMSNPGIDANIVSDISASTLKTSNASIAPTNTVTVLNAESTNKIDWGNVFLIVGVSLVTIVVVANIFDDYDDV
jgi:1,4-dihydroxy-2-naphthoate octaprenyltransferase